MSAPRGGGGELFKEMRYATLRTLNDNSGILTWSVRRMFQRVFSLDIRLWSHPPRWTLHSYPAKKKMEQVKKIHLI